MEPMISSLAGASTHILGVADNLYWTASLIVAVGLGGLGTYVIARMRDRSVRRICENLNRVSADVQADLREMQIEDTCGTLGAAWNHLLEEVATARHELDAVQVRQQALQTLNRYETKWFSQLLNQLPCGLIIVADDWMITFSNSAADRLLGAGESGLKGKRLTDFVGPDLAHINPASGMAISQTCRLIAAPKQFRLTAMSMGDGSESNETALVVHDVSAELEREKERGQFLDHITHELRTPLTNIRAYAETLSEGVLKDPETLRECYNVIVGETQRLSRLVEDILSLSQMEAGAARLKMGEVNVSRLIRQVVEDMQAQADEKGLELLLAMPAKVPAIRGDKERLAVVLTNLVGNAIKYTPRGGKVEVTCGQEGSRLRFSVADTGLGISPQDQGRVFEKFYRAMDERVAELPGTGLGLALALEIVRTHGGDVSLQSELNKGSTFTVVLPIGNLAAVPS